MGSLLDLARFNSGLKILFPQPKIEQMLQKEQPLWSWLPKRKNFFGRKAEIPINYAPPTSNSHTFSTAQANKKGGRYTHFEVTRKRDYILFSLDRETMEASENDVGGYISAKQIEVKGAFIKSAQNLGADLQGNGGGAIGRINATVSSTTLTLRSQDLVHFEPDMVLQASTTDGTSGVLLAGGATMTVTAVDYDLNTITVDANIAGLANTHYLFPAGNFGNAISGFEGWIPTTRPVTATLFNNVDRSAFPSRLAGIFYDGSALDILEALERAAARGAKENANPETCWVNYNRFADISLALGAKLIRDTVKVGKFGFDAISFHAGGRVIKIMADQNIADDVALFLDRETWYFYGLKDAPRFLNPLNGNGMVLEPTADGVEIRIGWNGELVCVAPGKNIRCKLAT